MIGQRNAGERFYFGVVVASGNIAKSEFVSVKTDSAFPCKTRDSDFDRLKLNNSVCDILSITLDGDLVQVIVSRINLRLILRIVYANTYKLNIHIDKYLLI